MAIDGAFDRILVIVILLLLAWIIYEKRKGNEILGRFFQSRIDTGGNNFGIRKH